MLKKEIYYKDFNGDDRVETVYFHLAPHELIELEVSKDTEGGFSKFLEDIVNANNRSEIIKAFKEIILMAYGEKSADGRHFTKSDEMREKFYQSRAFAELFLDLSSDAETGAKFVNALLPDQETLSRFTSES